MLAVIPARGGSKGLPGKNIRPFSGIPLIAHSILMAKMAPEIDRVIVSTDDAKIAEAAKKFGADLPFMRPAELAKDDTPMWPVLRHALQMVEEGNEKFKYLLLLDPTSPGRIPADITGALEKLEQNPDAVGIVGVSKPEFNPIWHCVVEKEGWMELLIKGGGSAYGRRQDVPPVYRINASLYIWKTSFIRQCSENWLENGKHLLYEIPEVRAIHIDDLHEFERAELLLKHNLIFFPWLTQTL